MVRKLLKTGLLAAATIAPAWCYGQDLRGALAPQRPDMMPQEYIDGHAPPPPADFWGGSIGAPQIPPYLYHHPTYHLFHHPVFHNPIWHHPAYHAPFHPPTIHNPPYTYARRKWPCHGTGDLFPHIEWYPEAHGYWRFMPTTYEGVMLHARIAPLLGGDEKNPYDNRHIDQLFDDLGYTEDEEQGVEEEEVTTETTPAVKEDDEAIPPDVKKPEEPTEGRDGLDQSRRGGSRSIRKAKRPTRSPIRTLSGTGFEFKSHREEATVEYIPASDEEPALRAPLPAAASSRRGKFESTSAQSQAVQSQQGQAARVRPVEEQAAPISQRTPAVRQDDYEVVARPSSSGSETSDRSVVQPEETSLYEPPVPLPPVSEVERPQVSSGVRRASHEQPVQQNQKRTYRPRGGLLNLLKDKMSR